MGTYSELVVVKGDVRGYESALASASAKTKSAAASWVSTLQRAGTSLTTFGKSATKWVTLPLLAAGVAAIKFASDAEETANKVRVTFGKSAEAIFSWSETSIEKMGMAAASAQDMATQFGLLFQAAELPGPTVVELSQQFTQLAADMSSFFNVPFEDALMTLRSGLVGETEPLRRFGVLLSEARVQEEALRLGLVKTTDEITEQDKVVARSSLIMGSLTKAHGDFERTSESTANQIRQTVERLKEMAAEIGTDLLPVAGDFLKVAQGFIGFLSGMSEGARQNVIRLAALALILGPVARLLGATAKAAAGLATALAAVKAAGLLGTGVLGAVIRALPMIALNAPIAAGAMVELWDAIAPPGPGKPEGGIEAMAEANKALGQVARETLGDLRALAFQVAIYDNALSSGVDTQAEFDRHLEELGPRIDAVNQALAASGVTYKLTAQDLADLGHGHAVAGLSAQAQAEAEAALREETRAVAEETEAASVAMTRFANLTKKEFQEWKEGTTSSMNFVEEALQSLAGEAKVTAEDVRKAFAQALKAQADFSDNAVAFLGKVQDKFPKLSGAAQEMVARLAEMGPEGAAILAALAGATERQQRRILDAWNRSSEGAERFAAKVRAAAAEVEGLPEQKTVHLTFVEHRIAAGRMHRGGQVAGRARTDVPILAQEGEFVINRESARRLGPGTLAMLNRYHAGGLVTPAGGATPGFDPRVLAEAISMALQKIPADGRPSGRELVIVPVAWAEDVEARVSAIQGGRGLRRRRL